MNFFRNMFIVVLAVAAAASEAITFSNVNLVAPPLSTNWSYSTSNNSISFYTPNAVVGDGTVRNGTIALQYDALSDVSMVAVGVYCALGAPTLGSGSVNFTEKVYQCDPNTGSIGGLLGISNHLFLAGQSPLFTSSITLSQPVLCVHVEKTFVLDASVDTPGTDLASIAFVNQAIQTGAVPEPSGVAALGLGLAIVLRRRKA